jgi:Flp pilus assembly protein TadB
MEVFIAIAHLFGGVLAAFVMSIALALLQLRHQNKTADRALREICVKQGIPFENVEEPKHAERIMKIQLEKFSADHFQNRLSDLIGTLALLFNVVQLMLLTVVAGYIFWVTATEMLSNAPLIWVLLPLQIAFLLVNLLIYVTCRLITGRSPGQARSVRKGLMRYAEDLKEGTGS